MSWHEVAAHFFGGVFLANFVPHFVAGVSGRAFPSPFARPPFRGISSPAVNVLWGLFNLAVAYVLLVVVGSFDLQRVVSVAVWAAGFALASVALSRKLGRLQGGSPELGYSDDPVGADVAACPAPSRGNSQAIRKDA